MNEQVPRIGVVGCGYWGKNLVRNFYALGSLEAICDIDKSCISQLIAAYPVTAAYNASELFRDPTIQAVALSTPAAQHYVMTKQALLSGKDVFVEKPLALRVEEGQELVDLANKHGRILMVGHLLQYHPAILELKRMIRSGDLGKVEYISSSRLNLGKLRTEEDILWSFAPHDVAAILFLLDELPLAVAAQGGSYLNPHIADTTLSTLDFSSGAKAHIFVSWLHPFKEQKLVIVGDGKMAVFDDTEDERKLVVFRHRVDWVNRLPVAHKAQGEVVPLNREEPLRLECQHFLECVRDRTRPRTDGESALRVLRILHACEQSVRERGRPVALEVQPAPYFVHSTAVVDQPCEIGEGTHVWHYSHVMANSKLGRRCNLGQNVHVASGVTIGNNVKIQNNVSVYTGVHLEDDVFCGPSMVFTNVINPRSHVNRRHEYMTTLVKRGATLGANSTIVCGVTIGTYAFVAAGAVVTHDVPDYALVMGVPAKQVGWMCQCGIRLSNANGTLGCAACGAEFDLQDGHAVPHLAQVAA